MRNADKISGKKTEPPRICIFGNRIVKGRVKAKNRKNRRNAAECKSQYIYNIKLQQTKEKAKEYAKAKKAGVGIPKALYKGKTANNSSKKAGFQKKTKEIYAGYHGKKEIRTRRKRRFSKRLKPHLAFFQKKNCKIIIVL